MVRTGIVGFTTLNLCEHDDIAYSCSTWFVQTATLADNVRTQNTPEMFITSCLKAHVLQNMFSEETKTQQQTAATDFCSMKRFWTFFRKFKEMFSQSTGGFACLAQFHTLTHSGTNLTARLCKLVHRTQACLHARTAALLGNNQ